MRDETEGGKYFVYGNILTGEFKKVKKRVLIIEDEEGYQKFLKNALKKYGVKSEHPVLVEAHGSVIIVESGEGLRAEKGRVLDVDDLLGKLLQNFHEKSLEASDILDQIIELYGLDEEWEE